jgi:uncharacterized protein with LGFP repeats
MRPFLRTLRINSRILKTAVPAAAVTAGLFSASGGVALAAEPTIPPVTQTSGLVTSSIYIQRPLIESLPAPSSGTTQFIISGLATAICARYFPAVKLSCTTVLATLGSHGLLNELAVAKEQDACVRLRYANNAFAAAVSYVENNPQYCYRKVGGAIGTKYMDLGGRTGFLGYALTDELATPNKPGRFNHFQNGSIYWSASTGAHEIQGAIRDKWASLGWENSFLGFPTTNETSTPDKVGRFNHFEGGSIYWSPNTGAHEVHGAIRDLWAQLGWENSQLGFPTSDEFAIAGGGRRSNFQNGCYINWFPATGATAYCNSIPTF